MFRVEKQQIRLCISHPLISMTWQIMTTLLFLLTNVDCRFKKWENKTFPSRVVCNKSDSNANQTTVFDFQNQTFKLFVCFRLSCFKPWRTPHVADCDRLHSTLISKNCCNQGLIFMIKPTPHSRQRIVYVTVFNVQHHTYCFRNYTSINSKQFEVSNLTGPWNNCENVTLLLELLPWSFFASRRAQL